MLADREGTTRWNRTPRTQPGRRCPTRRRESTQRFPSKGNPHSERESTEEAITKFYRYAAPKIVAVLVSSTGATMLEASEAAHQALVDAVLSWNSIHTNPLSWCITAAKRHWGRRKYSAEASFDDIPQDSPLLRDHNQDVVRQIESRLRLAETVDRMPLLTAREADVINLHLAALTTAEIAAHLTCAEATVRVHLANARRKLKGDDPDRHDGGTL